MSFPRYPKYKDSGVEWLGAVPEHWDILPLGLLSESIQTGPFGSQLHSEDYVEGATPIINPSNIQDGKICPDWSCTVGDAIVGRLHQHKLLPGDIIFARRGEMGRCALVLADEADWLCGTGCLNVRLNTKAAPAFVAVFLRTVHVRELLKLESVGSTMDNLNTAILARVRVPTPPLPEQAAIAAFLDRETAKIDELVAQQRRLMELLKEKRQAVISHAVTQGLNPNAPMKPSGIEWIGDVPAHWEVQKLKYLTRTIEQGWSPQCEGYPAETEAEWGVLKVGCVNGGIFSPSENKVLPPELEPIPALGIVSGDLLISRANTRELVGSAAVAEHNHPNLMLCDKLYRLRFNSDRCSPVFACRYLGSTAVRGQIELGATGASASMVNIPQSVILELTIAAPLLQEQCEIVASLDRELAKFNALTAEAQRAIDLLQERRTALISAAVTGQIDVRALTAREAA